MTVFVAFLRAVNVGGRGTIAMAALKALCADLGFRDAATLLQSGNIVFSATGRRAAIASRLADGIAERHGFRPAVALRTADELAAAIDNNPFPAAATDDPAHLLLVFPVSPPDSGATERLAAVKVADEKLVLAGGELYAHYAGGVGRSKVTNAVLERALGVPATGRNWNTVTRLLRLAKTPGAKGR